MTMKPNDCSTTHNQNVWAQKHSEVPKDPFELPQDVIISFKKDF